MFISGHGVVFAVSFDDETALPEVLRVFDELAGVRRADTEPGASKQSRA